MVCTAGGKQVRDIRRHVAVFPPPRLNSNTIFPSRATRSLPSSLLSPSCLLHFSLDFCPRPPVYSLPLLSYAPTFPVYALPLRPLHSLRQLTLRFRFSAPCAGGEVFRLDLPRGFAAPAPAFELVGLKATVCAFVLRSACQSRRACRKKCSLMTIGACV